MSQSQRQEQNINQSITSLVFLFDILYLEYAHGRRAASTFARKSALKCAKNKLVVENEVTRA